MLYKFSHYYYYYYYFTCRLSLFDLYFSAENAVAEGDISACVALLLFGMFPSYKELTSECVTLASILLY